MLFSISSPYGVMGFKVFLQNKSHLRAFIRSVLSMNVTESITFKNPLRPELEKCLKRCSYIKASEQ